MKRPEHTDICLILEGTYPYVRGGVSSWVHNLVMGLPELSFSLLLITSDRSQTNEIKYDVPDNVRVFAEVFIHESIKDKGDRCSGPAKREAMEQVKKFHRSQDEERKGHTGPLLDIFGGPGKRPLSMNDAFYTRDAWQFVVDRYKEQADGTSFIDYFWTWRAVHAPLMQTLIAEIPPAGVYHAISTGYAGLLGVLGRLRTGRPLILTEHGIYVRERAIDIARADWIYEEPVRVKVARPGTNPLKEMWINFFVTLGKATYDACDEIITLFGGNVDLQHSLGANPEITGVIPNGVAIDNYAKMREDRDPEGSRALRVGFVGRVVPIKDVKCLVRACGMVHRAMPDVEFWLAGPTDEDEAYFAECQQLTRMLGIEEKLTFMGMQNVKDVYPKIDVMVLTSISEGQPLTILEAACAGVPSVATDVGACSELLNGRTDEDKALGPGGLVTGVGAPDQTAEAILNILRDGDLRRRMAESGIARTEQFYRQSQVLDRYRKVYRRHLATETLPVGAGHRGKTASAG